MENTTTPVYQSSERSTRFITRRIENPKDDKFPGSLHDPDFYSKPNIVYNRLYKKEQIHVIPAEKRGKIQEPHEHVLEFEEYPTTYEFRCNHCREFFKTTPFFEPKEFNSVKNYWLFFPFGYCSASCVKGKIIEGNCPDKAGRLGLLFNFVKQYINPTIERVNYIPLSLVKGYGPCGSISRKKYEKMKLSFDGFIIEPPCVFVDTSVELHDLEEKEKRKRKRLETVSLSKATEEEQLEYKRNIARVFKKKKVAKK